MSKYVIDQTVYFDRAIQEYLVQHPNCKQIVILGSDMDARAYRMGLSNDILLFEIDYASAHDYKSGVLKGISFSTLIHSLLTNYLFEDDQPSCQGIVIKADIGKDDSASLLTSAHTNLAASFDSTQATHWLAEGFIMYIPETAICSLILRLNELSANDSAFVFDGWSSRDQHPNLIQKIMTKYMASLSGDALGPLTKLGWQIQNTSSHSEMGGLFYTLLK